MKNNDTTIILPLSGDTDQNVKNTWKALGLSDEEIEKKMKERYEEKSQEEIEEGFRNLIKD